MFLRLINGATGILYRKVLDLLDGVSILRIKGLVWQLTYAIYGRGIMVN